MIAAVPACIGDKFEDAPPGHKYSLYLKYWQQSTWKAGESGDKQETIKQVRALPPTAKEQVKQIRQRLDHLLQGLPEENHLTIYGRSSAPFVTGMGIQHPLENGFAFLNPYGLPYLPGSSIKGVLRHAARELCTLEESNWTREWVRELFGDVGEGDGCRGALVFWDCVPELKRDEMLLDVMTPHYGEYYQGNSAPHDAGEPKPVVFLTVPANSSFVFNVSLSQTELRSEALLDGRWKTIMEKAFDFAFEWVGFGAKTSVGYGAMKIDQDAIQKRKSEAEQEKLATMTDQQQKLEKLRKLFEEEKDRDQLRAGGQVTESAAKLLAEAPDWPEKADRYAAADLAEEIYKEMGVLKGKKGRERKEKIQKLREG